MIQKESIELLILLLQGEQSFSCHPRRSRGALWALGRGVNSGNMVLLSLASPLGEEGHEVAKGCWRVRIGKKLKVEQAAYRRSG